MGQNPHGPALSKTITARNKGKKQEIVETQLTDSALSFTTSFSVKQASVSYNLVAVARNAND